MAKGVRPQRGRDSFAGAQNMIGLSNFRAICLKPERRRDCAAA